jgi:hypothetical protein
MGIPSLSQLFLLISWFAIAALIYILALIARFYEAYSGEKTYYQFFSIPVAVLGIATARYSSLNRWGGDWAADVFLAIGGILLLGLCYRLYRQMTSGR